MRSRRLLSLTAGPTRVMQRCRPWSESSPSARLLAATVGTGFLTCRDAPFGFGHSSQQSLNRFGVSAKRLRRVAGESRLFDRFVERKAKALQKANPTAGDGEILKMILDWISSGGLTQLLAFITQIINLFA